MKGIVPKIAFLWVQFISNLNVKYLLFLLICNDTAQLIICKAHAVNIEGTNSGIFCSFGHFYIIGGF